MNLDMKKMIKKETVKEKYYNNFVSKLEIINKEINHLDVKIVKISINIRVNNISYLAVIYQLILV
jgi:hypothetical protein